MDSLPTDDEIRQLPLWAAVSLAARCARRVLPEFRQGYPKARKELLADLERAVAIAEQFAAQGAGQPDYAAAADGDHAVDAAEVARKWAKNPAVAEYADAAAGAAYAAGEAADVAENAGWANRELVYSGVSRAVCRAATSETAIFGIIADYRRVAQAAREQGWDDAHSVPPSFYEPL